MNGFQFSPAQSTMKIFVKCKNLGCEVGRSLVLIFLLHSFTLGHALQNARVEKYVSHHARTRSSKDLFTKPFCRKVKLSLLSQTDDEYNDYDVQEGVETDLEKHFPGCGPPTDVEVKVLNQSAFLISWLSQTPQAVPIKYFILEYEQAKYDDKPVTKCRQWVENESIKKNETYTLHNATVKDLISDHKYQFRVVTVYNEYQFFPSSKTSWIYLPGDGQAPRVTRPPGITAQTFDD